ncbi:MAG: nicotinate-nucleotide adenylyltransferase [Chitinophagaceae bacterium]|jgi:nicotinate-nucleotide adenylyltransferase|nr:nicotinate-nucleotide adenylyltransferase [Chitinophagaceae bacterium]MBP6045460.1 nicotinate-nucleotide adenylyltransferase [Ferruginibacter sp.]NMD28999.1 nicotinate-nucleotide adenylyltransferase [Bacteroidota bacterium]MBK7088964.1 nicotinate-nucleotide adenylyltransferase [Chitinophagaceae bacterium]MBK7347848.1 nicotinate-nucleotide adenylyltransferase [Chitinophagaceae bacterium]
MNIGLFFGSFNPIHNGHLIIAKYVLQNSQLNKLWFVVSPQNPFKSPQSLLNENHRLHLVNSAIEGETDLKACNIEFKLPKPSYTINSLTYLAQQYPDYKFTLIVGSDSFQNINKWKNYETLVSRYPIIIYKRPGFEVTQDFGANLTILEAPLLEISSTYIRSLVKKSLSIRYLVPDAVKEEIERNNYYRSALENKA